MNNPIPDGLPTLSAGAHTPGSGKACLLEFCSVLAGEQFSDQPQCVNPVLAEKGRYLNDTIPPEDRQRLAILIPRLIGTDAVVDNYALESAFWYGGSAWAEYSRTGYDKVAWLSALIDEYDRLAGRTSHRTVTPADLRTLAATVAAGAS